MWATRFKELSAKAEQIIAGNCVKLMESKPWTIYWFTRWEERTPKLSGRNTIHFREPSADIEQIKQ